jgi:ankyrin repeat protein
MSRASVVSSQAPVGFGSSTWANEPPSEAERAKVKAERQLIRSILNNDMTDFNNTLNAHVNIIDINFESSGKMTPLHTAMAHGHVDMAASLLSRKANINAVNALGFTPLISASINGHEECVRLALKAGANKCAKSIRGETAAEIAASKNFSSVVNLLK